MEYPPLGKAGQDAPTGIFWGDMSFRPPLALALLGPLPIALLGQQPVRAPGGPLPGVVRDSATGLPVGYALVVVAGHEQRVFATEAGKVTLSGLGGGAVLLRGAPIGDRGGDPGSPRD